MTTQSIARLIVNCRIAAVALFAIAFVTIAGLICDVPTDSATIILKAIGAAGIAGIAIHEITSRTK